MFMSKKQRKVRMLHYEDNVTLLHEKSYIKVKKFMKIEYKEDHPVYQLVCIDLVTILVTPIITNIKLD